MKVAENMVIRRMFGPESAKVAGRCRNLHFEFYNLCSPPNIIYVEQIKRNHMGWSRSAHGKNDCVRNFGWKP